MRLNASLLVLTFAAATGVNGVPVTIDHGDNSASSHQLVRRGWIGKVLKSEWVESAFKAANRLNPYGMDIYKFIGAGGLTSLLTVPFVWNEAKSQERENIESALGERRRTAYEREQNEKNGEGQNGSSNVEDPQESSEDQVQLRDSESQTQPRPNQSGQAVVNEEESAAEPRDSPTNYLPPTGLSRSGVFGGGESGQSNTDSYPDTSMSANANSDRESLAGESQNSPLEDEANTNQASPAPDGQQETREKSIEELLTEDDTT